MNYGDKVTPGHDLPNPFCGVIGSRSIRAHVMCPENPKHDTRVIYDDCHRPGCPVCWGSWANRAADRAADTITGFKDAHNYRWYPNHIDISPPLDVVPFTRPTAECLRWLLEEVNDRLDVLGVVAAAVVPHPYRIRKECKQFVNDNASKERVNRYVWALKQDNWFELVYFSPHVHAITYGRLIQFKEFQFLTGWQYHNHGRTHTRVDVVKVVRYLLSHAWVRGNSKTVRYLRGMSSTKLLVTYEKTKEPDLCRVCKSHKVRVPYVGKDGDGNVIVPYQDLHYADKEYRVILVRTVRAKSPLSILLECSRVKSAAWWRRYYKDRGWFCCCALIPKLVSVCHV